MITGERTGGELMDSDKGVASEVGEGSTLVTEETELWRGLEEERDKLGGFEMGGGRGGIEGGIEEEGIEGEIEGGGIEGGGIEGEGIEGEGTEGEAIEGGGIESGGRLDEETGETDEDCSWDVDWLWEEDCSTEDDWSFPVKLVSIGSVLVGVVSANKEEAVASLDVTYKNAKK